MPLPTQFVARSVPSDQIEALRTWDKTPGAIRDLAEEGGEPEIAEGRGWVRAELKGFLIELHLMVQ